MKKEQHIISGDIDVTDEIIGAIQKIGFDDNMLERMSGLIMVQLYAGLVSRAENVFTVFDEVQGLEGCSRFGESRTKSPTIFSRKPYLRGLWHKHYFGAGIAVMARNLMIALNNYGLPQLEAGVAEGEERFFTEEDAARVAHEAVMDSWSRRSDEHKLTGHWIIYAVHEENNHYLSLGKHTDSEADIRRQIDAICLYEFPFLENLLQPCYGISKIKIRY
ncbi:hypothetical protein QEU86_RS05265 [Enterobacter hormaechei]